MTQLSLLTLNISFVIYFIWLIPQIFLNFKRKNVVGLSLFMHAILCIGYLCDLIYGFGREMQWQYRMVTLIGLMSLSIQHYQFWRYGLINLTEKKYYFCLTLICISLGSYALAILVFKKSYDSTYINAGVVAQLCWLSYALPQVIRNARQRNTSGLSPLFVVLGIALNTCDITSAWGLGWDYPSIIGPFFALLLNFILVIQIVYYTSRQSPYPGVVAQIRT